MKNKRKWIYIGGGVVAVLLLVIVLVPLLLDANQYRPRIEAMLDSALNRKVNIGNIRLSILSGGVAVDNISITDDPAFGKGAFLEAKGLTVGVELIPLIFSHALNVTGITIDQPQVALLRSHAGEWNFSTLGAPANGGAPAGGAPATGAGASTGAGISVRQFNIKNGTVSVGDVGGKTHSYNNVNLTASDLSYTTQFPFALTASTPGNGTVKLTGKAGPLNQKDAQETPLDADLEAKSVDLTATGFVEPSSGIAGIVDFSGSLASDGQDLRTKGKMTASKLQLVQGGSPARQAAEIDYDATFRLKAHAGALNQGEVHVGKALARLTGTYSTAGETPSVQMKVDGQNMPATDLEAMLPALGVILPAGTSIQSGTVNATLAVNGPVDRLVTTGPVSLSNAKLAGFDLGSKMGALSSFAGVPKGSDTMIQTLSADVRIAPEGMRLDKVSIVVPAIGSIAGGGTIAANHALDFKMAAHMSGGSGGALGGLAAVTSAGGAAGGIPFLIHGTTSNPVFEPDVNAMVGGFAKGALSNGSKLGTGAVPGGQNVGQALGGLFGKKKTQ